MRVQISTIFRAFASRIRHEGFQNTLLNKVARLKPCRKSKLRETKASSTSSAVLYNTSDPTRMQITETDELSRRVD
jgi:hypothetical protein